MANQTAWSEGWQIGKEAAQHSRDRKDMLSDEDRHIKAADFINTRNSILAKLPSLLGPNGEKTPEYDQAYQSLTETQTGLGQLYHPDKSPGALQKDWHFLLEKMHGITAPKDKTPSATTSQTPEMTLNAPAAPMTTSAIPADPKLGQEAVAAKTLPGMAAQPTQQSPPLTITHSFKDKPAPGMVSQGNLDLSKRPNIDNGDGTHSSTFSMSFGTDKGEVLVPGVGDGKTYPARQLRVLYTLPDGSQKWAVPGHQPHNWIAPERPTPQNNEALDQYQKTGKHFGIFEDEKAADAYGKTLHEDQEKYGHNGETAHPVSPSGNITLPAGPSTTVTKAPPVPWGQAQVLKQKAASMQKAQGQAELLAAGAGLSPTQEAMAKFHADNAVSDAKIEATLKTAKDLGLDEDSVDELKRQLVGLKNVAPKGLTGANGAAYKGSDGLYYRPILNPDGSIGRQAMPPDWKPNSKAIRGTIINTKANGWIQTWVDPYNPSRVIGFQKVAPGSRYAGTAGGSSSTDPFGLTTTSSRSSMPASGSAPVDFDLSGMPELPPSFNGEDAPAGGAAPTSPVAPTASAPPPPSGSPNKRPLPSATPPPSVAKPATGVAPHAQPKAAATPSQLKSQVPAKPSAEPTPAAGSLPLDSTGHIPMAAPYNKNLIGAANQLLDGMDIEKLTIPQKAREAASNLARAYGWGGQGMFAPQQKLQIREAATFLNGAMTNPSMSVLDSWKSRQKLIAIINNSEGHPGYLDSAIARNTDLNPQEAEFLRMFRQLTGTISGLASLTRPGRPTEAGVKRLMAELPNPNESHSAADGRERLKRLIQEIDIATQKGNADNLFGDASTSSSGGGLSLDDFKKKHNLK